MSRDQEVAKLAREILEGQPMFAYRQGLQDFLKCYAQRVAENGQDFLKDCGLHPSQRKSTIGKVIVHSISGHGGRIPLIKELRTFLGIGLKEAAYLTDNYRDGGIVVYEGPSEQAEKLYHRLCDVKIGDVELVI